MDNQLNEFHFISDLFTGAKSVSPPLQAAARRGFTDQQSAVTLEGPSRINRFAGKWLGEIPIPFPKSYVLGVDIQQRDFEHYGQKSYFTAYHIWATCLRNFIGRR